MSDGDVLASGPRGPRVDIEAVFAASYRKLVVQLYGVVGNAGEAEDLVQEAFVRAYATGSRFTRVDNPEAWLRTVAINLHRNRWRKLRNYARIRDKVPGPTDLPGLEDHVEVVDALRRIPEPLRLVLVLHYRADRKVEEVAGQRSRQRHRLPRMTWYVGVVVVRVVGVTRDVCVTGLPDWTFVEGYEETVRAMGRIPGYRLVEPPTVGSAFGHPATRFRYRATDALEACQEHASMFVTSANGSYAFGGEAQQDVWVVDVDGAPITVLASTDGEVPARYLQELDAVVASIEFRPASVRVP